MVFNRVFQRLILTPLDSEAPSHVHPAPVVVKSGRGPHWWSSHDCPSISRVRPASLRVPEVSMAGSPYSWFGYRGSANYEFQAIDRPLTAIDVSIQRSDPLTPKMHPFASGDTTDSASLALFPAKAEVSISF